LMLRRRVMGVTKIESGFIRVPHTGRVMVPEAAAKKVTPAVGCQGEQRN
jgi:hypothetical protein